MVRIGTSYRYRSKPYMPPQNRSIFSGSWGPVSISEARRRMNNRRTALNMKCHQRRLRLQGTNIHVHLVIRIYRIGVLRDIPKPLMKFNFIGYCARGPSVVARGLVLERSVQDSNTGNSDAGAGASCVHTVQRRMQACFLS